MIQWLQRYSGIKTEEKNIDLIELGSLRKEVKHYKKKYEKEDKEMCVNSDEEEELGIDEQRRIDEEMRKMQQRQKEMRPNIIAEVFDPNKENDEKNYRAEEEKSDEKKSMIKKKCQEIFIFKYLDDYELNLIVDAFKPKVFKKKDTIIEQFHEGKAFYFIDNNGEVDCWKVFREGDRKTFLKTLHSGDSFGELSLLYSAPNDMTVEAKGDTNVLWALDRNNFTNIIKNCAVKRREKYKRLIRSIELFQTLNDDELEIVCDALQKKNFKVKDEIGKPGVFDELYIVEKGSVQSVKSEKEKKDKEPVITVIATFNEEDYFGETALIKTENKQFSFVAGDDCTLLCLDRKTFKRLLGPIENILKRNINIYSKFMKK